MQQFYSTFITVSFYSVLHVQSSSIQFPDPRVPQRRLRWGRERSRLVGQVPRQGPVPAHQRHLQAQLRLQVLTTRVVLLNLSTSVIESRAVSLGAMRVLSDVLTVKKHTYVHIARVTLLRQCRGCCAQWLQLAASLLPWFNDIAVKSPSLTVKCFRAELAVNFRLPLASSNLN